MDSESIRFSEEVADAMQSGTPVVALETALLSFGLPPPLNLATYLEMEAAVRESGSIPAGTAIWEGHPVMGLPREAVERLANGKGCEKASLADLSWIAAQGRPGATTVASTLAIAQASGCRVFATGGIGGVHPGVADDLDISADLAALGRYSVAVVCSGAKAILDIPKTLEALEALGVPVIGLGTDELPLFYSALSGHKIRLTPTISEAAAVVRKQDRMGLRAAVLICNPVPATHALDAVEVAGWIASAETEARAACASGRQRTPFVLSRLAELSGGRTVETNRVLLVSNARAAGWLAAELWRM